MHCWRHCIVRYVNHVKGCRHPGTTFLLLLAHRTWDFQLQPSNVYPSADLRTSVLCAGGLTPVFQLSNDISARSTKFAVLGHFHKPTTAAHLVQKQLLCCMFKFSSTLSICRTKNSVLLFPSQCLAVQALDFHGRFCVNFWICTYVGAR
jgi:hypothetical protein